MNRLPTFSIALLLLFCSLGTTASAAERPDPARWEKNIGEIEKRCVDKSPEDVNAVFIGSSSIRMWKLAEAFPHLKAINCGFGGSHLADSAHYANRLIKPFAPRCIVLYAGDNDIGKGLSPQQVEADYSACAAAFRKATPDVKILYVAIKPSRKRWVLYPQMKIANEKIQALIEKDDNAAFIDIASAMLDGVDDGPPPADLFVADGLHLSAKGYAIWTKLVESQLPATVKAELETAP